MKKHFSKNNRVLFLYRRLCEGRVISKPEEAHRFGVDERSIQRDIDDIRAFLQDQEAGGLGDGRELIYDRARRGFLLRSYRSPLMSNSEILAVSKILLESRAFSRQEMSQLVDKLVAGCVPQRNMKLVADLIANEKHHYTELHAPLDLSEHLWTIAEAIRSCDTLCISYRRQTDDACVERVIQPVALMFSEYYFYLHAFITFPDGGERVVKYDFPAIFRVDRIAACAPTGEKFSLPYAGRFQEGEFRKRVQFMYPGRLQRLRFLYSGPSIEAVLDRLPTAAVLSHDENGYLVEAEVYGKGILMWLLSQGKFVRVLSPQKLKDDMKALLAEMLAQYDTE